MSEQQAEQSGGETGALGTGAAISTSSDSLIDNVMASAQAMRVDSPKIAPDQDAPKADEPKIEAPKVEMPKAAPFTVDGVKADASKDDAVKVEPAKVEATKSEVTKSEVTKSDITKSEPVKAEAARPRELLIMSPRENSWQRSEARFESRTSEPKPEPEAPKVSGGSRRIAAIAAMLLLAVIAGAAGGAFATIGVSHFTETASAAAPVPAAVPSTHALETAVARIDADIVALKAGLEQTTKAGVSQFNKTSDRLERIEKAQAEPNAKLAKLSEAVDKLRNTAPVQVATAAAAPVPAAAKDVTGTVTAPNGAQPLPMPQTANAAPAAAAPKVEVGRLPTVEGWVLRDAGRGSALVEGRTGLYEVFAGDPIPGVGRVEAIRKQDGRWVVVTPKGLIVAR